MAWTITTGKADIDPNNKANLILPVTATDEKGRAVSFTFGPGDLTPDYIREQLKIKLAQIDSADAGLIALKAIENREITVKDAATEPADLIAFRVAWQRLRRLLSLASATPTTVAKITQLRDLIEEDLVAHPSWLDDNRIG